MDQELTQYLESHKYFVPTELYLSFPLTVFQILLTNCFNIVQEHVETAILSEYNTYSVRKETQTEKWLSNQIYLVEDKYRDF